MLLLLQSLPVFIFANQAGLDMLETTLVALQDITLDKIFDDSGRKALYSDFAKIMQQVRYPGLHLMDGCLCWYKQIWHYIRCKQS